MVKVDGVKMSKGRKRKQMGTRNFYSPPLTVWELLNNVRVVYHWREL